MIWPAALDAFESRPFTGIGYGAFVETSIDRMYETRNTFLGGFKVHKEQVHNTFLGQLAELGIPGLVLFLGLLGSTLRMLLRTAAKARRAGEMFVSRVANALLLGHHRLVRGSILHLGRNLAAHLDCDRHLPCPAEAHRRSDGILGQLTRDEADHAVGLGLEGEIHNVR